MTKLRLTINGIRMVRLARISLADDWRSFILTGLVIGGLVIFSGLTMRQPAVGFLFKLMLLVGFVMVSKSFAGLWEKEKGTYLMMLPASMEEKFFVQWFASLVGFYLFSVLSVTISGTLSNLLAVISTDATTFSIATPPDLWETFQTYFFFHAIFFAGALFFKGNNFLKTLLTMIGIVVLLTIGSISYLKNNLMPGGFSGFHFQFNGTDKIYQMMGNPSLATLYQAKMVLFVVVPVLLYLLSFLRFKHMQIKG